MIDSSVQMKDDRFHDRLRVEPSSPISSDQDEYLFKYNNVHSKSCHKKAKLSYFGTGRFDFPIEFPEL
jgi:hypothetical protein